MQYIAFEAFKALAPNNYGAGLHHIKLRLSLAEAEKFEKKIKDISILKSSTTHKGKPYVHYLYIGSNKSVGYMNILNTLQVLKKDRKKASLAKRIDSHIAKAEALAFIAEMLDYQEPPHDLWEF